MKHFFLQMSGLQLFLRTIKHITGIVKITCYDNLSTLPISPYTLSFKNKTTTFLSDNLTSLILIFKHQAPTKEFLKHFYTIYQLLQLQILLLH